VYYLTYVVFGSVVRERSHHLYRELLSPKEVRNPANGLLA